MGLLINDDHLERTHLDSEILITRWYVDFFSSPVRNLLDIKLLTKAVPVVMWLLLVAFGWSRTTLSRGFLPGI